MARDPVLLALVLADNVVPDPNTGKNFILGTITQLFADSIPVRMNQICLYLCIGDAHDCREPGIEVVHLESGKTIMERKLPPLPKKSQTGVLELSISLGNVEFPDFGSYEFKTWMDGVFVGGRKFTVIPWKGRRGSKAR